MEPLKTYIPGYQGEIGDLVEVRRIGAEEVSVEWRIRNVLNLRGSSYDDYSSPFFKFGDDRWRFYLNPNWKKETWTPASGWVKLSLDLCDAGPPRTLYYCLGIRGSLGVEKKREGEMKFAFGGCINHWDDFCSRSELVEHGTSMMPDGVFNITCVLRKPSSDRGVCSLPHPPREATPADRSQSSDKQGCVKFHEDFAKLLASGEKSDVTLQVDNVEFKVHKLILFARCPALSVSLQHDSRERTSSRIVIEDSEPKVFQDFLHYLYTGSVQSLTEQNALGLYQVANKYLVEDLKQQCLEHIRETLTVQTFCDTIKLALLHEESGLLQRAADFGAENIQSILMSPEWQSFNCEDPRQANEVIAKCLGP